MSLASPSRPSNFVDAHERIMHKRYEAPGLSPSDQSSRSNAGRDERRVSRKLSFVIPVKDEQESLVPLYERICEQLRDDDTFELIFIDDGSKDGSWNVIRSLVERDPERVRGLKFRRNAGKAAALTAGFRAARGAVIFTLDADLQDDPKEIRRFLAKLFEGYDLVSGWKKVRHDPWHKVLPSRIFNRLLSWISGVKLHDHNCGFKCYRAEVVKNLTLHGELHRMVPALAAIEGYKSTEIVVEHHPRKHGVSKYGFERYLRGFVDMMTVGFLRKYRDRPAHFIAGVSATFAFLAFSTGALGISLAILGLPIAAATGLIAGSVFLGTAVLGSFCCLIAEITNRGGLRTGWKLPIIEDTAAEGSNMEGQQPPAAPVDLRFASTH